MSAVKEAAEQGKRILRSRIIWGPVALALFLALSGPGSSARSAETDIFSPDFDDSPLQEPVENPDWFKLSFLDMGDDLREAIAGGKRGVVIYFGQKYCPYCQALMEVNFAKRDIAVYTQEHFDVVAIDIRGNRLVTDFDGRIMTEKQYASDKKANFTPSLLFYDASGEEVLRLIGYYPPYEFRAALEYVADRHYQRESFREYLARADAADILDTGSLNQREFFAPPPHVLDRSQSEATRPLLVVFEQIECHACDVLHAGPFSNEVTLRLLDKFKVVQLNLWAPTPVVTPNGQRTRADAWAEKLGLFYAPTLIFFDEHGGEVIRVASVVHFNRLRKVMRYVLEKGYQEYGDFQTWRRHRGDEVHRPVSVDPIASVPPGGSSSPGGQRQVESALDRSRPYRSRLSPR